MINNMIDLNRIIFGYGAVIVSRRDRAPEAEEEWRRYRDGDHGACGVGSEGKA